jgi:hypothetical protein
MVKQKDMNAFIPCTFISADRAVQFQNLRLHLGLPAISTTTTHFSLLQLPACSWYKGLRRAIGGKELPLCKYVMM